MASMMALRYTAHPRYLRPLVTAGSCGSIHQSPAQGQEPRPQATRATNRQACHEVAIASARQGGGWPGNEHKRASDRRRNAACTDGWQLLSRVFLAPGRRRQTQISRTRQPEASLEMQATIPIAVPLDRSSGGGNSICRAASPSTRTQPLLATCRPLEVAANRQATAWERTTTYLAPAAARLFTSVGSRGNQPRHAHAHARDCQAIESGCRRGHVSELQRLLWPACLPRLGRRLWAFWADAPPGLGLAASGY